jgi:hypothetical protein
MRSKLACVTVIAGAVAAWAMTPLLAQEGTASENDPYDICRTKIENVPLQAYDSCEQYLEGASRDDAEHAKYVKTWLTKYEKVLPYVRFLQGLYPDENAPWFVYQPDMGIELPQTSDTSGPHKIQISRSFGNSNEEQMLRKAEAVYAGPSRMIAGIFMSLDDWTQTPPGEMAPIWGVRGNDDIRSTNVVTARAVRYYYDLSLDAKVNPHLAKGFTDLDTALNYDAAIKHYDRYSHNGNAFMDVYVADLTLQWSSTCGALCGMGFTRNKLVVLDASGNVVAMYLDAPVNSESWVS